jgi:hypothetical protein
VCAREAVIKAEAMTEKSSLPPPNFLYKYSTYRKHYLLTFSAEINIIFETVKRHRAQN